MLSRSLTAVVSVATVLFGCSSSTRPTTSLAPFAYVADDGDLAHLFILRNDSVVSLTSDGGNDTDPQSAAGRIVFTSDRDGNAEIYIADLAGATQQRVTNSGATDRQPTLNPSGSEIVFTSNLTGIDHLYMVAAPALGDTEYPVSAPLPTGDSAYAPESSPSWSPDGLQIAFVSTRTGTSQVFVVPAAGGDATQVTHEAAGAFSPTWTADSHAVVYVTGAGLPSIRRVTIATGATSTIASDSLGVADPTCAASTCLGVTDPLGDSGAVVSFKPDGGATRVVLSRTNHERQPAWLVSAVP